MTISSVPFESNRALYLFTTYELEISSFNIDLRLSKSWVDQQYLIWGFQSKDTKLSWPVRVPLHFILKISVKWSDSGSCRESQNVLSD